jgi:hypothetical protein
MKRLLQNDWTLAHFISYIAAITAILLAIQLIIQIVMFSHVGMDFPVKFSVENSDQVSSVTRDGLMFLPDNQQEGRLIVKEVENRSGIHSFFLVSFKIVESGMFIFCAFLVWQIFRSVARSQPFSRGNYKKLFIVGWIFVLAEFFAFGRAFYLEWLTFDAFASDPFTLIRTTGDLSNFLFIGIVIIVIGYVFKEGHRIYEEQKLTV